MPKTPSISRSLAPGVRHQLRSNARMRISSSVSGSTGLPPFSPVLIVGDAGQICLGGRPGPHSGLAPGRSGHVRSQDVTTLSCLTFLTDFGLEDGFVAACHGVAAAIAPAARIIDITHLVPPGDVRRGAAVLAQTVPAMPPAVHVAVVDPGVGTARRAIAVQAGAAILVGPDNGLLSWAITALGGADMVVALTNPRLWRTPVSPTFHGRDIFMPVAAHLVAGTALAEAGTQIGGADLVWLAPPTH